ncbi:hypothetical protein [Halobacterium salinarum]|uniref:Uncharacterized protein n=1 Tax=Halobacterium salinarum TaxID=2242 RepID=A0A841HFL8_HALSI|nr:hypothetical protein [Halobacterium salinarum]MBB6091088.1 hypothetical protein [Halobacterium salinarum]UEB92118.1 hypothetical protein LJ422_00325 [Halobacterium salinarum NRC-34001]
MQSAYVRILRSGDGSVDSRLHPGLKISENELTVVGHEEAANFRVLKNRLDEVALEATTHELVDS